MLQNGKLPTFLKEDAPQQIFHIDSLTPCYSSLRKGLEELGIYHVC